MDNLAGLGRLHIPDKRRMAYPMAAPVTQRVFRNHLLHGPVSYQGATPHCVAHAWDHLLRFLPVVNARKRGHEINKLALYQDAQKIDYWPGENYDGTSVDAGARILRAWGFLSGWTWAWDAETVMRHVLEIGPVVVGTTWTYGMFTPDRDGFIHPDGAVAGGHAYVIKGGHREKRVPWSTNPGIVYGTNSYSDKWGRKGHFSMALDDLDALIKDNGEACAPHELDLIG